MTTGPQVDEEYVSHTEGGGFLDQAVEEMVETYKKYIHNVEKTHDQVLE